MDNQLLEESENRVPHPEEEEAALLEANAAGGG